MVEKALISEGAGFTKRAGILDLSKAVKSKQEEGAAGERDGLKV